MDTISGALADLPDKPVTVVFVTTDPSRDTPAVLHKWLGNFNGSFVGLTGTPAQLAAAQKAAGVSVAIADKPDKHGNYQVGHAASVLAYTPDGLQHLSYPFGTTQSDWVHDIPQILGVEGLEPHVMMQWPPAVTAPAGFGALLAVTWWCHTLKVPWTWTPRVYLGVLADGRRCWASATAWPCDRRRTARSERTRRRPARD